MGNLIFYAHSGNNIDRSDWQSLMEHLLSVASLSGNYAQYFGSSELAYLAGLLHDLGKYTNEFQARLDGGNRVDHATAGAKIAIERWKLSGKLIAYAIAGHHSGLANGIDDGENRRSLKERLKQNTPMLSELWLHELILPEVIPLPGLKSDPIFSGFQCAFLIRMIFSCVVDADYIDTEKFYLELEGKTQQCGQTPILEELRYNFNQHLDKLKLAVIRQKSLVNYHRENILNHARKQALLEPGLFRLTVPTGGGKTLTSMAFALDHAIKYGKRRIIYVIPFTSIIEQNAKIFREAFGNLGNQSVLEHHSNFSESKIEDNNTKDKLKLAMENWDLPIIVTTAVQFFESLFSDRKSQCRKLHNVSGSVIILDEAQMLPLKFLRPIMVAIDELARNYQCSIVLCTATQPALLESDNFKYGFKNVREIAPSPQLLFNELNLVKVVYLGELPDEKLIEKVKQNDQILVIVNNRRHAQSLYNCLQSEEGIFHLSTLMCAEHRTKILATIKYNLANGLPCKVVSTSLIEAGVDVDFPCVMRAEAGLDSIAQAAGRCNRERLYSKENSIVYAFTSSEWEIPTELRELSAGTRAIFRKYPNDILCMDAITDYFKEVYWLKATELDKNNSLERYYQNHAPEISFPFQEIAKEFKLIDTVMQPVFIPFDDESNKLIELLRIELQIGPILRKLQRYIVQVPLKSFDILAQSGAVSAIAPERFGEQFWYLINPDIYSHAYGLSWSNPTFMEIEKMII